MQDNRVYILGGAQTDFSKKYARDASTISEMMSESVDKALSITQLDINDVESVHIGNFVGELFAGQGQLGGVLLQHFPALAGVPSARHEAACASGSMAILVAMRDILSGHAALSLVNGVEMMRNVDGKTASEYLGAAAYVGHEAQDATYPWVYLFSEISDFYQERYGLDTSHLAAIAKVNYDNAKRNPNAQTRSWTLKPEEFEQDDIMNPYVEGALRKSDCARITDGSATIFLASADYARAYAAQRNIRLDSIPYIKGWGHRSAPISLAYKLDHSTESDYLFPHLRGTITDALQRAELNDTYDLDAIETHDCFTISEYIAIEHFGIAKPGEAWKAIEERSIEFQGALPINPSGGLIGLGHPVGATGVRMLLDAYKQVADKAGDYQVHKAKNVATLNIGGSFTTTASFVVGR